MIKSLDQWGPFAHGLDETERIARARLLRGLAVVILGARGADLATHLLVSETEPGWLPYATEALDRLASLDRRRLLSAYGVVSGPMWCT